MSTQEQLHEFTSRLIHFRREHPIFRRPKFFQGRKIRGSEIKDIMWFNPGGTEMNDDEWTTELRAHPGADAQRRHHRRARTARASRSPTIRS